MDQCRHDWIRFVSLDGKPLSEEPVCWKCSKVRLADGTLVDALEHDLRKAEEAGQRWAAEREQAILARILQ